MEAIRIKDITKSNRAISAVDGAIVYEIINRAFKRDQKVLLDFDGIDLTITAFLNACIGKLYSEYSSESIKEHLDIRNLPNDEIQLLKLVIDRAKLRFSKQYPAGLDSIDIVNED